MRSYELVQFLLIERRCHMRWVWRDEKKRSGERRRGRAKCVASISSVDVEVERIHVSVRARMLGCITALNDLCEIINGSDVLRI